MRANHLRFGNKMDGFIKTILVGGFNGTVGIIWVAELKMRMHVRLNDGRQFDVTRFKLETIAEQAMNFADRDNDKLYCTGRMIVG